MFKRFLCNFGKIKQFTELEVLNQYLAVNKYPHVLVYFTAKWNPYCKITDAHVQQLSQSFAPLEIIKIDSDVAPRIAKHYMVKAEPEFVFCLKGDEVIRQIGLNKEGLLEKAKTMLAISQKEQDSSQSYNWVPFGTNFEKFYKTVGSKKDVSSPKY